jgi:hypothetical protein
MATDRERERGEERERERLIELFLFFPVSPIPHASVLQRSISKETRVEIELGLSFLALCFSRLAFQVKPFQRRGWSVDEASRSPSLTSGLGSGCVD